MQTLLSVIRDQGLEPYAVRHKQAMAHPFLLFAFVRSISFTPLDQESDYIPPTIRLPEHDMRYSRRPRQDGAGKHHDRMMSIAQTSCLGISNL